MRWLLALFLAVAFTTLVAVPYASAEAVPERGIPPIDQAVPVMPTTVEVWFSEPVDPNGTSLAVVQLDGDRVDRGDAAVDPNDATGQRVVVGIYPGLDNGIYEVRWNAVSAVDGSVTSGVYRIIVDPAASPEPLPQIATQQAPVSLPVVDGEGTPGDATDDRVRWAVIGAIAAIAIVTLLIVWFFRRPARGRRWRDDVVDRL